MDETDFDDVSLVMNASDELDTLIIKQRNVQMSSGMSQDSSISTQLDNKCSDFLKFVFQTLNTVIYKY